MTTKGNNTEELVTLLRRSLALCEENRTMAVANYNALKSQLDNVTSVAEMSEEGKLECEVNRALKLVFDSGIKMDNVIKTISSVLIAQLNADARIEVADRLSGGGIDQDGIVRRAVNIAGLLEEDREERDRE